MRDKESIMTSLVEVVLNALARCLNLWLLGNLGNANAPPSLIACGHGLGQNLHVDEGGNGLLLGILEALGMLFFIKWSIL